jgi:hypothetical protein
VPDAPESWRNIAFVGLTYEPSQQMQEFVQYYLFSVNGIPEADRDKVRLLLANPLWRYVFYSKIQFSPGRNVDSTEIADKKAAEFMKYCLPAVLKQLPSAEEIQKLYK